MIYYNGLLTLGVLPGSSQSTPLCMKRTLFGSLAYVVASAEKGEMGDERRRMLAVLAGTVLKAQVRKKERYNLY